MPIVRSVPSLAMSQSCAALWSQVKICAWLPSVVEDCASSMHRFEPAAEVIGPTRGLGGATTLPPYDGGA